MKKEPVPGPKKAVVHTDKEAHDYDAGPQPALGEFTFGIVFAAGSQRGQHAYRKQEDEHTAQHLAV